MERGGFNSFPLSYGRYSQAPEEWYGRGPAQMVLAELKTLNAEKTAFLNTGVMAGDPSYLLPSDDSLDFNIYAGSRVYGGMSEDGKPLVGLAPVGDIQITMEMMNDSKGIIHAGFLNDLYPLLFPTKGGPQKSAREVVEWGVQQGIFLTPLARQYNEYCAPNIERDIDILAFQGKFRHLEVPGAVKEAGGQYKAQFTSPLAQALDMPAIAGYMRTVEMAATIANTTGDRSVFYHFAFKRAIPAIAINQRAPEEWMSTPQEVAQQEKAAADAQRREEYVKSLPGLAAKAKADAITAKAQTGGNIGGTLSGTPDGGMPQMPEQ
jgi:hypothetical protein